MSERGTFVVFEGIDGAGTSTQLERYATYLRARGRAVHLTREPTWGPIGALIRHFMSGRVTLSAEAQAQVMALLFAADRLDHVAQEIAPRIAAGAVVLSDRYDLSSLAYQTATARPDALGGADAVEWVRSLNRFALRPDATLVVHVDPATAAERRRKRGQAADLYEVDELQRRLASLYRDAERLTPGDRIVHVEGDADPDTVAERVARALAPIVEP